MVSTRTDEGLAVQANVAKIRELMGVPVDADAFDDITAVEDFPIQEKPSTALGRTSGEIANALTTPVRMFQGNPWRFAAFVAVLLFVLAVAFIWAPPTPVPVPAAVVLPSH